MKTVTLEELIRSVDNPYYDEEIDDFERLSKELMYRISDAEYYVTGKLVAVREPGGWYLRDYKEDTEEIIPIKNDTYDNPVVSNEEDGFIDAAECFSICKVCMVYK